MERSGFESGTTLTWWAGTAYVLALGCASPGPPRPPSLHLPDLAVRLHARRVGDEVQLSWLTPANTTDGTRISGPIEAVVCREIRRSDPTVKFTEACDPVKRMPVKPGPAEIVDVLPQNLSTGAATLLAYRIELLNDRRRSTGRSDAVYAAAGRVPAPVGPLTVVPRRGSALIQWRAQPGESAQEDTMELHRTRATPGDRPKQVGSEREEPSALRTHRFSGAVKVPAEALLGASKEPTEQVTFTVAAAHRILANTADPEGTLDRTIHDGNSYVYVAQRVRKIHLSGEDLEVRGVPSPPATFAYRDTFPPRAPSGLVSVPGVGFGAAPSVDLSWEPNGESDLLGYNVYRQSASGAFAKLNTEPVPSSSFRDMRVVPGQTYGYCVTAIDRRRNESAPSDEIRETLRK